MSDETTVATGRVPRWLAARTIHALIGRTPDSLLAELPVRTNAYWEVGAERVEGGARLNITKVPQYNPLFRGMKVYTTLSGAEEAAQSLKQAMQANGVSAGVSLISLRDSFGEPTYPSYFVGRQA